MASGGFKKLPILPNFVILVRMCPLVAHISVSKRALHGSLASESWAVVKNEDAWVPLLSQNLWGQATKSAF